MSRDSDSNPAGDDRIDAEQASDIEVEHRFIWRWHPHGWLVALLVIVILLVLRKLF
jgi:hypothetical protein